MPDFDPIAFGEVAALPPDRVRHHLMRFGETLSELLENGFRCDEFKADNIVAQAQLLGFPALARSLSSVFRGNGSGETARAAELAIVEARPKIAELISATSVP